MAEERISIQVIDKYGDLRPTFVITRAEAIERMAKKICEEDTGVKWEENGVVCQHIYKDLAEAALDALISLPQNTSK